MKFGQFIRTPQFWKHFLLASLSVLIFLLGIAFFLEYFTKHNNYTRVPDFKGLKTNTLSSVFDNSDVDYIITDSIYSLEYPKGTVIKQDPLPGAQVKVGRAIYLTVNAVLSQQVPMPNLIDLSLRQAKSLLETYGLKVGRITYVVGLPPVIEQWCNGEKIKPNTMVPKGSKIDLVVGKETKRITVPELFGLSIEGAKELAAESRLGIEVMDMDNTEENDSMVFIIKRQDPPAGSAFEFSDWDKIRVWVNNANQVDEE